MLEYHGLGPVLVTLWHLTGMCRSDDCCAKRIFFSEEPHCILPCMHETVVWARVLLHKNYLNLLIYNLRCCVSLYLCFVLWLLSGKFIHNEADRMFWWRKHEAGAVSHQPSTSFNILTKDLCIVWVFKAASIRMGVPNEFSIVLNRLEGWWILWQREFLRFNLQN